MFDATVAPILVVEDSDDDFDTVRHAVDAAGVKRLICRAVSGGECLELLQGERGAGGQAGGGKIALPLMPVLILMDLNSHGVDGREARVTIKADTRFSKIPLVVLTTSANPKDVVFCYQAGANAYHIKPVRRDHYLLLVRSLLHYWLDSATLPLARVEVV